MEIRLIKESDAANALEIYKPYVLSTAITFEYEVPSVEVFSERIINTTAEFPWLVCYDGDRMLGYAYATKHRYRDAYNWSPESTIYVAPEAHGKGVARVLYETLFATLKLQGYINLFAGVVVPNPKSEKFHRSMGFEEIGIFKKIGNKLGAWHDSKWFQLQLAEHTINPPAPMPIDSIKDSEAFKEIILVSNAKLTARH